MAGDVNIVISASADSAIRPLQEVQRQVAMVDQRINQSTAALRRNATQYNRTAVSTNRFAKGALQQAGYQIADYSVQVANGTSKLQAFGQQGSQMLAIFGPVGAVLGAAVAIFSAVGLAAERSGRAAIFFANVAPAVENFTDKISDLLQQFKPLTTMVGGVVSGAFRIMGNMIDFVSDNLAALTAAAALFVAVQLGGFVMSIAQSFVSFAKALSASNIIMTAFNATVRRSPLALLAVVAGFAADRMGALEAAMTALKERFPEFFEAVSDAGRATLDLITSSYAAIDTALRSPLTLDIGGNASDQLDQITSATKRASAAADEARNRMKNLANSIESSMESAFMSIVDGTKSTKDAFRSMAAEIIKELYRVLVVQRMVAGISNAVSLFAGPAPGSTASILGAPRFEGGGYTGRGARSGGIDGRGGFPAILHPNETVIDHNRGGGMGTVIVNQTINVSTGVQQTVRTEIKQLMPQIAESAKQAVADAKRRGGSYGRAFA